MTYPDPFEDKSPWDEPAPQPPAQNEPAAPPVPSIADGNKVRITLKGGAGFDAPWITIDGVNVEDALAQLKNSAVVKELIDTTSKVGAYFASLSQPAGGGSAPKRFENGRVVSKGQAPAAETPQDDDCPHGRKLVDKGSWAAMFCQAPKGQQCEPLWRQKDGSFKAR
ncbi:hypothetical protein [Streptomyces sp. URMC 125]|uniref:hypothetical protein n=1 Tax=Streptomyces sp. URMC 125 TaxID=3423419 RepID=UPI003F19BE62